MIAQERFSAQPEDDVVGHRVLDDRPGRRDNALLADHGIVIEGEIERELTPAGKCIDVGIAPVRQGEAGGDLPDRRSEMAVRVQCYWNL